MLFFLALSKLNYRHLAMNFGLFEQIVGLYLITGLINICFECNIFGKGFQEANTMRKLIFILHSESIPEISNAYMP